MNQVDIDHAYFELRRFIPRPEAEVRAVIVAREFYVHGKNIHEYDLCEELQYSPDYNNRVEVVFVWRKRKNG